MEDTFFLFIKKDGLWQNSYRTGHASVEDAQEWFLRQYEYFSSTWESAVVFALYVNGIQIIPHVHSYFNVKTPSEPAEKAWRNTGL